jgi:two-component system chemotaxis response regulator CheB
MVKVLIVEDSPVQQALLAHILGSDPKVNVIGTAGDGVEALNFLEQHKPDVVTMDLNMPKMSGLEATRRIMETHPVPIVIVSANWDPQEVATTFRAIEAGALTGVEKPRGIGHKNFEATAQQLVQTVKLMSEVKVVRRWPHFQAPSPYPHTRPLWELRRWNTDIKLVAIGASTGGPPVLQTILSNIPKNFSVPILVVQHIAPGFLLGLTEWLGHASGFPICVPAHGDPLLPSHVYLAPDGFHLGVMQGNRAALSQAQLENNLRPSVSYLFRSVADQLGPQAVGVLLTGMGRDGAAELRLMRDKGAFTIAQDKESSVVHGMPGEAIQLNAAMQILSPEKIAEILTKLVKRE